MKQLRCPRTRGEHGPLTGLTRKWLGFAAVIAVSVGTTACSAEPQDEAAEAGEETGPEVTATAARSEGSAEPARSDGEHAESGEAARSEGEGEHAGSREGGEHGRSEGRGEHGEGEGEEEHGSGDEGEGEESGTYIGRGDVWDATRRGARLVLSFDAASNAFVGTVENTTRQTLCAVRVEVHLSTGTELGPTARTDLPSGESTSVRLPVGGEAFDTWTAHPEVSRCAGG